MELLTLAIFYWKRQISLTLFGSGTLYVPSQYAEQTQLRQLEVGVPIIDRTYVNAGHLPMLALLVIYMFSQISGGVE